VVYEEMKFPMSLPEGVRFLQFVGPELALEVSRQNIREKINAGWTTSI
jgi:hypothetical protein